MTDREQVGLRGPVKICCLERDYVYPDHHWVMHTTDVFSTEGDLLERRHRNADGSHYSTVCRYDEHGRIREKEHFGGAPDVREVSSYKYDALGRIERIVMHSGKDGDRVIESGS